jgi:putative tricarboxylic transport membrane protein
MNENTTSANLTPKGPPSEKPVRPFRFCGDDFASIVILLFVAVVYYISTTFDEVPSALSQGIPPERFPQLLSGVIGFFALLVIIQARSRAAEELKPVPAMVPMTSALLIFFVLAMDWLGTFPTIVLFCLALPYLWGERRHAWIIGFAAVFPVCVYLLFSKVLEVRFPAGIVGSFF